jgi:uncharacterized ion transporter superfamily protein YfcC
MLRMVRAPNVMVLIFGILVLVGGLTWIVPGGEFERAPKELSIGTRDVVVPGSYREVEANRQTPWDILKAPMKGFEAAAEVIGFILLVGGAFGVLNKTGAITRSLAWLARRASGGGRYAMIPVLMFVFSLGGALFGMAEETIIFAMITVPLAVSLRFDVVTGIAIPFLGSQAGFATAFVNPFTLGIAKGIADQPFDEGKEYRILCWFIVTAVCAAFVTWHAARVSRDPSRSPTPKADEEWRNRLATPADAPAELRWTDPLVVAAFVGSMVLLGVGALAWDWYIVELAGLFVGMAVVCGAIAWLSPRQMADAFVDGARELAMAALLVAFARGILIVAQDGKIIDTLLDWMSGSLGSLGSVFAAEAMYAMHTAINFFVPSGSGQAALTMPVMVPLSDLTGVDRETSILAFQFGDGFTNMIIPTNAVLISILAAARVDYGTWFRWLIPFQLVLFVIGMVLVAAAPF